jgi:hypothetical protein
MSGKLINCGGTEKHVRWGLALETCHELLRQQRMENIGAIPVIGENDQNLVT